MRLTCELGRLNDEAGMPVWSDPSSTAQGAMTTWHWLERGPDKRTWLVTESDPPQRRAADVPDVAGAPVARTTRSREPEPVVVARDGAGGT